MPFLPQLAGAIQGQTATQKSDRRPVRWQIHKPQLPEDMEWEPLATYSYESHIAIPPPPLFDPLPRKAAVAPAENLRSTLAGEWMYVPSSPADRPGFRPEYIELRLRQTGDNLHGFYRARYLVTHQAVSQDVTFQLDGRAGPQGGVFPWHGPSGASGEVTLQLQADGNLKVTWKTGRSGSEIGVISGTATLVPNSEQP
jgi:hypothetical protein